MFLLPVFVVCAFVSASADPFEVRSYRRFSVSWHSAKRTFFSFAEWNPHHWFHSFALKFYGLTAFKSDRKSVV